MTMSKAEEKETKLCPLKPWVTASGAMLSEIFCKCLEEQCAWWVEGECAIVIIAQAKKYELMHKLKRNRSEHG